MALGREHLAERVADVHDADVTRVDTGGLEGGRDDLRGQPGEVDALARQVAREVALVTAQYPHARAAHVADGTTTNRVSWARWCENQTAPPARS
jgi:hypothetical protein